MIKRLQRTNFILLFRCLELKYYNFEIRKSVHFWMRGSWTQRFDYSLSVSRLLSANHVHSQIHRLYRNELTHFHKTFPREYFSEHQSDWAGFTRWLCFVPDMIVATEKKIKGESSQHKTVDIRHVERKLNFPQKDQCSTANLLPQPFVKILHVKEIGYRVQNKRCCLKPIGYDLLNNECAYFLQ